MDCPDVCYRYWIKHPYNPIHICPGCETGIDEDGKKWRRGLLSEPPEEGKMTKGVTVNQFVCLFPPGTRIKIHMIFADTEKTERFNDEDFGVWGSGDFYGITRYPVGECTVREAIMLKPFNKDHRYDLDVWAYEPKYRENLEKLREPKEET